VISGLAQKRFNDTRNAIIPDILKLPRLFPTQINHEAAGALTPHSKAHPKTPSP
jgi:hypothetical protein